jgi:hypothetical protein
LFSKNGLGFILADFFTNSSGHPAGFARLYLCFRFLTGLGCGREFHNYPVGRLLRMKPILPLKMKNVNNFLKHLRERWIDFYQPGKTIGKMELTIKQSNTC